jgi:hypothetical protein
VPTCVANKLEGVKIDLGAALSNGLSQTFFSQDETKITTINRNKLNKYFMNFLKRIVNAQSDS